jgi:acyl dehydratase
MVISYKWSNEMKDNSLITVEVRAMIGKEGEPITGKVYEKEIRRFCYAVGDLNPLYLDKEKAILSKNGGIVAPPMFYDVPTIPELPLDALKEDGLLPPAGYGGPQLTTRIMAGGKTVEFFKSMRPGDKITSVWKIVDIYEKKGRSGPLLFVIIENKYTNQDDELLLIETVTGISR